MIIDGTYSFVPCKIYKIADSFYQMDCYTNGTINAVIFNTISIEQNIQKNIRINLDHKYSLKNCSEPVKKFIDFKNIYWTDCTKEKFSNNIFLNLEIKALISGFIEDESIIFYLEQPSHSYMNCTIPFSRNGETIFEIKCKLNAIIFPIISYDKIVLQKEPPKMEGVEMLNWDKINYGINTKKCHQEYQLNFSDIKYNGENCKSKNENMISLLGYLSDKNGYDYYLKESYSFNLRSIINEELKNISCEIYKSYKNNSYYQMDCNIIVNNNLELYLYEVIAYDELSNTSIYIKVNDSFQISDCSKKNKFINFNGKVDVKFNSEKSIFELDIYSENIGFEEEKKIQINLEYPRYGIMDCTIPSSNNINNDNNTFIKCTMDMNKYPLIEGDYIELPNNIFNKENYSLTKWDKIKKNIYIDKSYVEYSLLTSPDERRINYKKCDDKGNNIISMQSLTHNSSVNKNYSFNISGIVDDELKNIPCKLNFVKNNIYDLICYINGKNSLQIFQTKGVDTEKNEAVLIKVQNYMDFHLMYCPVSKTKLILAIVLPIAGAVIIIITVLLILKYKKKHSNVTKDKIENIENINLLK